MDSMSALQVQFPAQGPQRLAMGSLEVDIPDISQRGTERLRILLAKMRVSIHLTVGFCTSPTEISNNISITLNSLILQEQTQFAFPAMCYYQGTVLQKGKKGDRKRDKDDKPKLITTISN